jgi:hypothetical protein
MRDRRASGCVGLHSEAGKRARSAWFCARLGADAQAGDQLAVVADGGLAVVAREGAREHAGSAAAMRRSWRRSPAIDPS